MSNSDSLNKGKVLVKAVSPIWIIPLATLLIAGYLGFQAWMNRGVDIEVVFQHTSGVIPNKTRVRYRDVDVGIVRAVRLDDSLDQVRVSAELNAEMSEHLSVNSKFWVVSPDVSISGVSGLGTLLSGVYIEFDPGAEGEHETNFIGLEEPPAIRSYEKGKTFLLHAKELVSLNVGSQVYYRKIPVGKMTAYKLSEDGKQVVLSIFIQEPFDQLVFETTNFWNTSGISLELNSEGFTAKMESIATLLGGGIAFDTPVGASASADRRVAKGQHSFHLFRDRVAVLEDAYTLSYPYLLRFSGSVRGLQVGAPVELQGIQIGVVKRIRLSSSLPDINSKVHVYIDIQPQRFDRSLTQNQEQLNELLAKLVSQGLRAELKTGNLLTGSLFVDLVITTGTELGKLVLYEEYTELPTSESQIERISRKAINIINKIDGIPVDTIGKDLAQIMKTLREMADDLKAERFGSEVGKLAQNLRQASTQLEQLLNKAESTLTQIETSLAITDPDTRLHQQFVDMVEDISEAAKALELLMNELSRNPQSLIFGNDTKKPDR